MNYELMKKAYEDFNGVWPYNVPDGMAVRNGKYANVPSVDVFNYREWNWVGTKADFNAYSESLKKPWRPKVGEECEYLSDDKWIKAFIAGKTKEGKFILERINRDIEILSDAKFRPIKTEREQLIEIIESCNMSSGVLADAILSSGYRKTEEGK